MIARVPLAQLDIRTLRLHPVAEQVPEANATDRAHLRADLDENGQLDPIDVVRDPANPEGGIILDGRTRWQLLSELGSETVLARVIDLPEADQPGYVVRRAVNRRHLTEDQKATLIIYLDTHAIAVAATGERIGMTDAEIAGAVGVSRETVKRAKKTSGTDAPLVSDAPTHVRVKNPKASGGTKLVPKRQPRPAKASTPAVRRYPPWWAVAGRWLRRARKEDARVLRELDERIHAAMKAAGVDET